MKLEFFFFTKWKHTKTGRSGDLFFGKRYFLLLIIRSDSQIPSEIWIFQSVAPRRRCLLRPISTRWHSRKRNTARTGTSACRFGRWSSHGETHRDDFGNQPRATSMSEENERCKLLCKATKQKTKLLMPCSGIQAGFLHYFSYCILSSKVIGLLQDFPVFLILFFFFKWFFDFLLNFLKKKKIIANADDISFLVHL